MEVVTTTDFWSSLNMEVLAEIMGVCLSSFFIGYATGYKFYAVRRFLFSSVN